MTSNLIFFKLYLTFCLVCNLQSEIQKIIKMKVAPSRIIYANPCKQVSFIKYAHKAHVDLMTFDNEMELHKIKDVFPDAR